MTSFDFNAWHLDVNADEVDLSNSNITSNDLISIVERLKEMPNLVKLSLNNNEITTIDSLGSLVNLKVLNLNQNPITNSDILDSFSNLTELYVNGGHNQITTRSQYITNGSSSIDTINKYEDPDSPVEQAYGLCDRCHRKSVPSSFDVAFDIEKKRIVGLVIDTDARDTKLEMVFDFLVLNYKRPRICGNGILARRSYVFLQSVIIFVFVFVFLKFIILEETLQIVNNSAMSQPVQSMLCQGALLHYQCPHLQNRLRAANLTYTSDIDAQIIAMGLFNNKLSNHSQFWSTLTESKRDEYRFDFFQFRAATMISRLLFLLLGFIIGCQQISFFKSFYIDKYGNNNSLYPAVLVRQKNGRMQFVRRRKFVMETAMCFALVLALVVLPAFGIATSLASLGACTSFGAWMTGFSIQKDNVNELSISLTECKTADDFVDWTNKLYKPTIALLHSWSRSLSLVIILSSFVLISIFLCYGHKVAILQIQLEQQEGVITDTVHERVRLLSVTVGSAALTMMIFFFGLLVSLSMISMQYKGLQIVLASLKMPHNMMQKFCFEDFLLLQNSRGAFTIYGFPVTLFRSLQLFQFVAVTSLLSMISLAYLSPYY